LRYYAGGGGGSNSTGSPGGINPNPAAPTPGYRGQGGVGGGTDAALNGVANTGGGAGSSTGGSGIVIIRYKYK
jgi:hypothetical protein